MILQRGDLDGLRLTQAGRPDVWLVYGGVRHRIPSPAVYDALFRDTSGLVEFANVDEVELGDDVAEGSCLVRADGDLTIYLLTGGAGSGPRLHHIQSFESFTDFHFDEGKVRDVPALALQAVPPGSPLVSAADRAARR